MKTMAKRALMRGDRSQSEMIENHGIFGMRSNLLNDTPTYKKQAVGLQTNTIKKNSDDRNNNQNTKVIPTSVTTNNTQGKLGNNILDALK